MKLITSCLMLSLISSLPYGYAMTEDDPLISKVLIDQFETRIVDGADSTVLKADAWLGYDLHKLWLKVDLEKVGSELEESELQMLYSRALDPYWDLQVGWRHNNKPGPTRDWLAVGVKGLAPYWVETDAALFFNDAGQVNVRLTLEYEIMFTQRLVLISELGMNFFSRKDEAAETGSGLSDMSFGLRLGYEIKRAFAPYIGINRTQKFGGTADHAHTAGESVSDTQFVLGIRAWF